MERRRRAVATTLLLTLLAARDAAAVSKVDVLKVFPLLPITHPP
jgi:hypothetical protein